MGYAIGDIIDGRYEVTAVIGKGTHGIVYRATDVALGSQVAVKCLHPEVAAEPGLKTRMMREARALGALSGTAAVQVLGVSRTHDGGMYIAMELVVGRDFSAYLREIESHGGRLSVPKLMDLLGPIADKTPNRGLAAHLLTAVKEAGELLDEIDQLIAAPAEAA